eukprot:364705-Chlamydomonas_euryale.AAC.23
MCRAAQTSATYLMYNLGLASTGDQGLVESNGCREQPQHGCREPPQHGWREPPQQNCREPPRHKDAVLSRLWRAYSLRQEAASVEKGHHEDMRPPASSGLHEQASPHTDRCDGRVSLFQTHIVAFFDGRPRSVAAIDAVELGTRVPRGAPPYVCSGVACSRACAWRAARRPEQAAFQISVPSPTPAGRHRTTPQRPAAQRGTPDRAAAPQLRGSRAAARCEGGDGGGDGDGGARRRRRGRAVGHRRRRRSDTVSALLSVGGGRVSGGCRCAASPPFGRSIGPLLRLHLCLLCLASTLTGSAPARLFPASRHSGNWRLANQH